MASLVKQPLFDRTGEGAHITEKPHPARLHMAFAFSIMPIVDLLLLPEMFSFILIVYCAFSTTWYCF
jgi:hypothetical protein